MKLQIWPYVCSMKRQQTTMKGKGSKISLYYMKYLNFTPRYTLRPFILLPLANPLVLHRISNTYQNTLGKRFKCIPLLLIMIRNISGWRSVKTKGKWKRICKQVYEIWMSKNNNNNNDIFSIVPQVESREWFKVLKDDKWRHLVQ